MEGTAKRQVNAEEMLAELKRVVESSTCAPNVAPPSPSTVSRGAESWRSRIDTGSDRPIRANADDSIGQRTDLQKSTKPSSGRWKLTAGGLALAGAATVFASFALVNKAPNLPTHELSGAAPEGLVRPQNEQTLEPSSSPRAPPQESPQAAPLEAGALETPPAGTAPATGGSVPAGGKAGVDPPDLASSGLESAARAFKPAPPSLATIPVATQRIGPDGAPIATAPSTPASTDSAPPLAETPKPVPSAPSAPPQLVKPDRAPIATAPPTPASTDSTPLAGTPKPNATPTASVSNESAGPSTSRIDSTKKPPGKTSAQKPRKTAKASAKPVAQAERQSTEPPPPKEAERSPQPAQGAGNPTAVAPAPAPTVQQRFADGMTHAFGYLMHLPGALVPHRTDPNADGH
jgi:hypothetical protein